MYNRNSVVVSVCGVTSFRVMCAASIRIFRLFFVSAVKLVHKYSLHHVVGVVDFLSYAKLVPLGHDAVKNGKYSVHYKECCEVVEATTWKAV